MSLYTCCQLVRLLTPRHLMTTMNPNAAILKRMFVACAAIFAASVSAYAQAAAEPAAPAKEPVLTLSKFEVTTTQDKGYVANNAATGFKTNQELMKIPQSVTVITRDLIDDIGATMTSDVLQYAGASQFYRGESIRLRGARTLNPYMDDAIENVPYSDNVNIEDELALKTTIRSPTRNRNG